MDGHGHTGGVDNRVLTGVSQIADTGCLPLLADETP